MKKNRVIYYDILNICACISVIAMHCNGIVHIYSNTSEWKEALVVEVIAYWAVPVFFMLTGAKLMDYRKKYSTLIFLKKRLAKIVIPWISWCIIWFIIHYFVFKSIEINCIKDFVYIFYNGIFNNEFQSIYWFFIPMIMIYLCIPVLSCLTEKRSILWYIIVVSFITYSIFPVMCNIFGINYNYAMCYPLGGGYILYVLLGYLLSTVKENKYVRRIMYFLAILSVIIRYFGTLYLSVINNTKDTTFWGDQYFMNVFLAISVFLFFKNQRYRLIQNSPKIQNMVQYISNCSFGVYLIHYLVITFFISYVHIDNSSLLWRTLGIFVVYYFSLLIVSLLKKIPFLSEILVP